MRKVLVSIALASATVASTAVVVTPAMAQPGRGHHQPNRFQQDIHREIRQDINELERRIQRAQQRRTISVREAQGLRREAIQIRQLYNRFSRNGLDRREVRELEQRINRVHRQLRFEQRDWDRRWR